MKTNRQSKCGRRLPPCLIRDQSHWKQQRGSCIGGISLALSERNSLHQRWWPHSPLPSRQSRSSTTCNQLQQPLSWHVVHSRSNWSKWKKEDKPGDQKELLEPELNTKDHKLWHLGIMQSRLNQHQGFLKIICNAYLPFPFLTGTWNLSMGRRSSSLS